MSFKVLHIIDSGGLYGAETVLLSLMEEQIQQGLTPILASIGRPEIKEKPLEGEARRRGLRVEVFRMRPGPNLAGIAKVLDFARREGIDLLHSHGYKSNILFGLMPKRLRGLPLVITVHGYTWKGGLSRMLFYQKLDSLSLRFADRVVLVNGAMREHPWLRGQKNLEVVDNGIALPVRAPEGGLREDILGFASQGFCIAAVGRVSREKGSDLLFEAFAGLVAEGRDLRLALLGEGRLREELEARAEALGIADRVFFPGYVQGAGSYLPHFDLFVMPSLTEGLPMVLLEAMAGGVPIVATRVGGMPEVLEGGKAGRLVAAGDAGALKAAIAEVLDRPEEMAARVVRAGERVRRLYSSESMAEKYGEIYRQLVPEGWAATAEVPGEAA